MWLGGRGRAHVEHAWPRLLRFSDELCKDEETGYPHAKLASMTEPLCVWWVCCRGVSEVWECWNDQKQARLKSKPGRKASEQAHLNPLVHDALA